MKKLMYAVITAICSTLLFTACQEDGADDTPTKFKVTFDSRGGSSVESQNITQGSKITRPATPTYGEYIFVDWFKEQACTNAWNFDKDIVEADITLYAKWTTTTYTVSFNTNGGSSVAPITVAKGATVARPLPPTKNGSAFDNWYKEAQGVNLYDFSVPVTTNLTLHAKWITVSREALIQLVVESYEIQSDNYTYDSYQNMVAKRQQAEAVTQNETATSNEIIAAYTELSAAIAALVKLPNREVVDIWIDRIVEGFIYVTPNTHVSVYAYAADSSNEPATDRRVSFEYNVADLAMWSDGEVHVDDRSVQFQAKSNLTVGQTIKITIKSVANPTISKSVTLKVAGVGQMKALFLAAVNALPEPKNIKYEHYTAIAKAFDIYYSLTWEDQKDPEVIAAKEKASACEKAYYALPQRIKFSFNGNICKLTGIDGDGDSEELGDFTYVMNSKFPAGDYTQKEWMANEKGDGYYQVMLVLKTDGTGLGRERTAKDSNGSEASAWEDTTPCTYTYSGTQAAGGMFYITFDNNEDEPTPSQSSMRASRSAARTKYLR